MRCIIAGSRDITNRAHLEAALQACPWTHEITSVLCGGATGVDALGDRWALRAGLPVRYYIVTNGGKFDYGRLAKAGRYEGDDDPDSPYANVEIVSDWAYDGAKAGPIRNRVMAQNADALIAIPLRGRRKGTDSMIAEAKALGLRVFIREVVE